MCSTVYVERRLSEICSRREAQIARCLAVSTRRDASPSGESLSKNHPFSPSTIASTSGACGSSRATSIGTPFPRLWMRESPT